MITDTIAAAGRYKAQAERERAAIDEKWTFAARQEREAEISAQLEEDLKDLVEIGREKLDELREQARVRHYKARAKVGPSGAEEWAEASARRQFVAAEVRTMKPEEIVREYKAAKAVGDTAGAWLIERLGQKRLEYLRHDKKGQDERLGMAAGIAQIELQELVWGGIEGKLKDDLKKVDEQQIELNKATYAGPPPRVDVRW